MLGGKYHHHYHHSDDDDDDDDDDNDDDHHDDVMRKKLLKMAKAIIIETQDNSCDAGHHPDITTSTAGSDIMEGYAAGYARRAQLGESKSNDAAAALKCAAASRWVCC